MGLEIERRFLVTDPQILQGLAGEHIRQGYLSTDARRTVRVRVAGERAWLTVKGIRIGAMSSEWEYEIPLADAEAMLEVCEVMIEKVRYRREHAGRTWEVDVFHGANEGLIIAEVELDAADASVVVPNWAGQEITGLPRYANSRLATRPVSPQAEGVRWSVTASEFGQNANIEVQADSHEEAVEVARGQLGRDAIVLGVTRRFPPGST
jgi:adenylate cyclase